MKLLKYVFMNLVLICLLFASGCNQKISDKDAAAEETITDNTTEDIADNDIKNIDDSFSDTSEEAAVAPQEAKEEGLFLCFVDAHGKYYETTLEPISTPSLYNNDLFVHDGEKITYEDENYTSRLGIDVSYYQGNVDWEKVKAAGYDFAFMRVGFRGYGESGSLNLDEKFHNNIQNAQAAGLDVGVYFFAQAINEEEAVEEAEFVLKELEGYELQMPVVYDPETIHHSEARTDNVTQEQFTKNARAFCETIQEAGYQPMIYCNLLWQIFQLHLSELEEFPIWYADYESYPQTPYHFEIWQYTQTGQVDGVDGEVDINIQLIPKEQG